MPCEWPCIVCTHRQLVVLHSRTVMSADDDASHLPSGENLTAETARLWPVQTWRHAYDSGITEACRRAQQQIDSAPSSAD